LVLGALKIDIPRIHHGIGLCFMIYLHNVQCFKPHQAVDAYLWYVKLGAGSSLLAACRLILDAFA
jgi:hypothetical protein